MSRQALETPHYPLPSTRYRRMSVLDKPIDLPVHLTRFVGRERELVELVRLLGSTRLLTLTDAGGSGKTRLARETALCAAPSFGRVAWHGKAAEAYRRVLARDELHEDALRSLLEQLQAPVAR